MIAEQKFAALQLRPKPRGVKTRDDSGEIRTLFAHYRATGDPVARERLVLRHRPLARSLAALDPIAPHEGRHSAASYLIEAGLNDLELTATIGHSDSRTTKRIYGHLFPDSSATIAAKLDAYHAASTTEAGFSGIASDDAPQERENPAVAGHS
jgi:integrase